MRIKKLVGLLVAGGLLLATPSAVLPAQATVHPAKDYIRLSQGSMQIIDPTSTLQPARTLATIVNTTACPKYIFYGVRGSGEGYEFAGNTFQANEGAQKNMPWLVRFKDDIKTSPQKWTDKKGVVRYQDGYGIGVTLGKVFSTLKVSGQFKGAIAAAAPGSATDKVYQAPPTDALTASETQAKSYVGNMFDEGIFASISAMYFITKACPTSKIILGGYSQGAFVASATVETLKRWKKEKSPTALAILPNLKAAFVLADPANPGVGLVSVIKFVSTGGVLADVSNAISKYTPINLAPKEVRAVVALISMSGDLSKPIGSGNFITSFANSSTETPDDSTALPVMNLMRPKDIVGDTGTVLGNYLKTIAIPCATSKALCLAAAVANIGMFPSGVDVHTSYANDTWAAGKFSKWLVSLPTLK